ncbi:alpha/beta hydrolase [Nocardia sp. NPDC051832]|uniref:alpha/beta fold hydrolase n=1 Tax=Nocardia sp. NPDC051832 TaxID=3155673 RepID=UPI00343F61BA
MRTHSKALASIAALALSAVLVTACESSSESTGSTTASEIRKSDAPSADGKGFYAEIGGGRQYYEIHGTGKPLILLHGGLTDSNSTFGALVPELAKSRKVIAVDLQAHGHTPDRDRPLRYETLADDVAALITHLNLGQADLLGYSLGGGVALQVAARTPDLVNRLAIVSAPYRSDGWLPETRAGMAAMDPEALRQTPIFQLYSSVAPDPGGWTALVTKTRQLLTEDYDWTAQVAEVQAPALLLTAESDALSRKHATDLVSRLSKSGAQLEILPGTTHYDVMYRADLLLPLLTRFLDTPATR